MLTFQTDKDLNQSVGPFQELLAVFSLLKFPDASCFFVTTIGWKVDPDQSFEDAATGPSFEFDNFVRGDKSFGEAGSKNHLSSGGSDARG